MICLSNKWYRMCLPTLMVFAMVSGANAAESEFRSTKVVAGLKPLFKEYCFSCHNEEKMKGELNLEALLEFGFRPQDVEQWETLAEYMENGEMPPEKKPQPSDSQRASIIDVSFKVAEHLKSMAGDNPGRVTVRRLNRQEYNNTIRDLLGVDVDPSAGFPGDEVGYGFDNIGDVLSLSPILLEKYLDAAEVIVKKALVTDYP
ncbi:DUF1587 domain-containing protein, partial [Verrucomicrobia bacterium]|nr:DUF1587 domain-containing protein [Verrucomicrobiota bacterium]